MPRIGARASGLRRLMIAIGVEPDRDARQIVSDNPARGQAQGRIGSAAEGAPRNRTADGSEAQKSTPAHPRSTAFFDHKF